MKTTMPASVRSALIVSIIGMAASTLVLAFGRSVLLDAVAVTVAVGIAFAIALFGPVGSRRPEPVRIALDEAHPHH